MKSIEEMGFGEYVKSLRIAEDRSLRKTAIAIGVTPQFFCDVETRKRAVFTPERLESYKTYLHLTAESTIILMIQTQNFMLSDGGRLNHSALYL